MGQVVVEVTQDQQEFLPGESLPVAVRIINRSGQTLHLGADPEWLTFAMEGRDGAVVEKSAEVPVLGEFDLGSSEVATKRVDLAPYFVLAQEGRYAVTATVHIKSWGEDVNSRPHGFDIIQGAKLWEQEVGVPPSPTSTNAAPQLRRYVLQQANYIRGQLRLYLRVLDQYGRPLKVLPIGPMVSFGRPDPPQIDGASNLHVLYQNGPSSFSYTVYSPNGELLIRQRHDYINSRPRLRIDDSGKIVVFGGVRRLAANDVPPSSPDEDTDDEPTKSASLTDNTPKTPAPSDAVKGPKP
jgi:hypothetical protein